MRFGAQSLPTHSGRIIPRQHALAIMGWTTAAMLDRYTSWMEQENARSGGTRCPSQEAPKKDFAQMTLAVAYSLLFDPTAKVDERSIFMATDSRITIEQAGQPTRAVDDGAKVILLDPVPAVLAFAGRVDLGERSLAHAAKLIRSEPSLTFEEIKELTLTAFKKFYRPGEDLWGLLGVVSTDGRQAQRWKLGRHDGKELTALQVDGNPAMIGDPRAQAAYETSQENAKISSIYPGGPPPMALGIGQRHCTIFDGAIEEMNRQGISTIGGPVQALLVKKDGWFAFSGAKYNKEKADWEQIRPRPGDVRFRYRESELRDLRRY